MSVTVFSDYQFESDAAQPFNPEFVGSIDLGSHPGGGDVRNYFLSVESGVGGDKFFTLWDCFYDVDLTPGSGIFAEVAYVGTEFVLSKKEAAALLVKAALADAVAGDQSFSPVLKANEFGLLGPRDISAILCSIGR